MIVRELVLMLLNHDLDAQIMFSFEEESSYRRPYGEYYQLNLNTVQKINSSTPIVDVNLYEAVKHG